MFLNLKNTHTKLDDVSYSKFEGQPYLKDSKIRNFEKEPLFNLRSRCQNSKSNFQKMNDNNIKCILGCLQDKDQKHTFSNCDKLIKKNPAYG